MHRKLFTSESVTEGHPDKVADQISDAVLDAIMEKDRNCRVACETLVANGLVVVSGEISTDTYAPIEEIARNTIRKIGYTGPEYSFDFKTCAVLVSVHSQSPDIALGVDAFGAGDQGIMFGYATDETDSYMPLPIDLAHSLAKRLSVVRKEGILPYLGPDGKTQVTLEYGAGGNRVDGVVVSAQHFDEISTEQIRLDLKREVIDNVLCGLMDSNTKIHINPTGRFVKGGPMADAGLTGRKIIVDTYGGMARHGGGAFSGKDPTKVDRSAAYAARWVAKNVVAAKLAQRCEIQLGYAIGVVEPLSISVNTFGTGDESKIQRAIVETFDLSPRGIIDTLDLRRPIYMATAAYGHFGRSGFSWEELNRVEELGRYR